MSTLARVCKVALFAVLSILICMCGSCTRHQEQSETSTSQPPDVSSDAQVTSAALPQHALLRLGSRRFLPPFRADEIRYSADGRYLATAAYEELGTVPVGLHIWERATGDDVTPADLKGTNISGFDWAPHGSRFVTAHRKTGLAMWEIGKETSVRLTRKNSPVFNVAWAPRGDRIAARLRSEIVVLDPLGTEHYRFPFTCRNVVPQTAPVIDFSADGKILAVAADTKIELHDLATRQVIGAPEIDAKKVSAVRVLPDNKIVAVGTDRGVQLLSIDGVLPDRKLEAGLIGCMAISHDGRWLASACAAGLGELMIWDLNTGDCIHRLPKNRTAGGVAFAPGDTELAIATRRVSFLKAGTWDQIPTRDGHCNPLLSGVLINGRLWTGEIGPLIQEWDVDTGQALRTIARRSGTAASLTAIDDHCFAVAGGVAEIEIFDIDTGKATATLPGHRDMTTAVIYSAKERRLISSGEDGTVRAWDVDTRLPVYEIPLPNQTAKTSGAELAMAPNGKLFACCNRLSMQIHVHRVEDGTSLGTTKVLSDNIPIAPLAFSFDSRLLATPVGGGKGRDGLGVWSVRLFESETGSVQSRIDCGAAYLLAIALSPDSKYVAIALSDETARRSIQIWSLENRTRLAVLEGHYEWPRWLSFTTDSRRLISVSQDTTAMIWDVTAAVKLAPVK